jgi:hypothetical protein
MGGAGEIGAIRRMGDGARDDGFDAGLAEQRQALGGLFQPRHQAVELRGFQLALVIPARRLAVPAGVAVSVHRAYQNAIGFFPQVSVGVGVTHHRQLRRQIDQFLQGFGDHVVVQHVGDGTVPGPPPRRNRNRRSTTCAVILPWSVNTRHSPLGSSLISMTWAAVNGAPGCPCRHGIDTSAGATCHRSPCGRPP